MLIAENYQSDWYDCYCNKTQFCCCSPRVRNYFLRKKARCGMCKLQTFCTKKNLIDGSCAKAFFERNSENAKNLRRFANKMWPLIKNFFLVRKKYLEILDDEYRWSHRDWNTFEICSLSLTEIIEYLSYLIELNGPERYLKNV